MSDQALIPDEKPRPKRRRCPGYPRSDRWMPTFLRHLAKLGNLSGAADAAGISYSTVVHRRRSSPAFDQDCRDAILEAHDRIDQEVLRRCRPFVLRVKE